MYLMIREANGGTHDAVVLMMGRDCMRVALRGESGRGGIPALPERVVQSWRQAHRIRRDILGLHQRARELNVTAHPSRSGSPGCPRGPSTDRSGGTSRAR